MKTVNRTRRYVQLLSYIFFFLLISTDLYAKEVQKIEILRPLNRNVVSVDTASVVVKVNDKSIKKLKFISEEGEEYEQIVDYRRDTYCKNVRLVFGNNTIIIRAYTSKRKIVDVMLELFYEFPAHRSSKYPPSGFKKRYFHTSKNERDCLPCHKIDTNEVEGYIFEEPKESNCFACHKSLHEKKYAHAPSVNWLCSECHSKPKSRYTKYPSTRYMNKTCLKCHRNYAENFKTKKYRHEPISTGGCTRCHNPHASEHKYFTELKLNTLCIVCHGDKARRTEKKGSKCAASSKGVCTECHNPHFSDKRFLYEPNRHIESKKKPKALWMDE